MKFSTPLLLILATAFLATCGPANSIQEVALPTETAVPKTTTASTEIDPTPIPEIVTAEPPIIETACPLEGAGAVSTNSSQVVTEPLSTITLPTSIYIIDDADGAFSSQRTVEEITAVYERVNQIWGQANIIIDVQTIERIELSGAPLQGILSGNFQPFFDSLGRGEIDVPQPSLLNGFYSQAIGGPNGIAPSNTRLFFVMDTPSVHDERVTSHEIGHILGLHHVPDDPDRLLFSGTNGMTLSPEEIAVTRYFAQGMLDRLR